MSDIVEVQVRKNTITEHRLVNRPTPDLADGDVLLRVDRFAVTANNVTYAVFGDAMNYWNFFPSAEPEWGIVPVWGFGDVVESRCDGVAVGERFYGYYPMASHVVVQPAKVTPTGFFDGVSHRRELHSVYNNYVRVSADPSYVADREPNRCCCGPCSRHRF